MFNNQNKSWQDYNRYNQRKKLPGIISGLMWLVPIVIFLSIGA